MLDFGCPRREHGDVGRWNERLNCCKGWCGEPLEDLLDGDGTHGGVIALMRATHQRRDGRLDTAMRMMCMSRHRTHLMGLMCLADDPTDGVRDRRAEKDSREDPRREASNHQIASIANFFADTPEQCLNNASEMP